MYRFNHNQAIIELLLRFRKLEAEYPMPLLSARRNAFMTLISRFCGNPIIYR